MPLTVPAVTFGETVNVLNEETGLPHPAFTTAYLSTLMDDSFISISASEITTKPDELLDYYKTIS